MESVVEIQKLDENFRPVGHRLQIAGPEAGAEGVWLATEVEGMLDPVSEAVSKPLGNRPGSRLVSTRVVERTLVFRVTIAGTGLEWASRDAAWKSLWDYNEYTGIFVTTEYSGCRFLKARLAEIEVDTTYDPHLNGATDVLMTVVADDPFWYPYNSIDTTRLHAEGSGVYAELDFDLNNLVYSGQKASTYPVLNFTSVSGAPKVTFRTKGWEQTLKLPYVRNQSFVLSTDPMARQLQPDTVWRQANGVRYTTSIPKDFTDLKIIVSDANFGKVEAVIQPPFYRAWG